MRTAILVCVLMMSLWVGAEAASETAENKRSEPHKGLTLQDIGRGLQSAANNIGNEIPKIGPAIGKMFKQDEDKKKESQKPFPSPSKEKN
jgi:hypothetical protein